MMSRGVQGRVMGLATPLFVGVFVVHWVRLMPLAIKSSVWDAED